MRIDTTKQLSLPTNWKIESHYTALGTIEWDPKNIELYFSESQKSGSIKGTELHKELADKNVLNATVLDWLLEHPDQIPESWKGQYVYFWGTIYRNSDDNLYVRYLYWNDDKWNWNYNWLDNDFDDQNPAVLLASGLVPSEPLPSL